MRIIMYCHNIIWYYSRASSFWAPTFFSFCAPIVSPFRLSFFIFISFTLAFSSFYSHIFSYFLKFFRNISFSSTSDKYWCLNFDFISVWEEVKWKRQICTDYSEKKKKLKKHSWNILYRFQKCCKKGLWVERSKCCKDVHCSKCNAW